MELPANLESSDAWRHVRAELRRRVGQPTYDIWLASLRIKSCEAGTLVVQAPASTQAWVAKRFGRILELCARSVLGDEVHVAFAGPDRGEGPQSAHASLESPAAGLNPRYTFDQFIIGEGNRLAHAASLAVAELPGQAYNPLFLHAPPGLGKTHLLHAIGNYLLAYGGGATVRYATVEAFTNHFITALSARRLDHFKSAYRDADVLLIDDVQFLASKAKTEEEFFHTFNALYETGRQLVVTCDRLPRQLVAVEERLRERFEWGLVADIRPPDFGARVAILRKRAALDGITIDDPEVLELIAGRIDDNVRALEGALIRIVAYHSLTSRPITAERTRAVLDAMYPPPRQTQLTVGLVKASVASHYRLEVSELTSQSRVARVAWPRQVAIYLARKLTDTPLPRLGEAFGGRNHATLLHACKRVSQRLATDPHASADVEELESQLCSSSGDRSC